MIKYFDISEDKLNIKCKLYYSDIQKIRRVLISCHGFGGSKDNNSSKKLSEEILNKYDDICLLTFDWPCHGTDVRKKIFLNDCNDYFEKVIDYSKKKFKTDNLYLNATSFGGYLSLKYIHEHGNPFKKILLRCPAVTMYNVLTTNILTKEDKIKLEKDKQIEFGFDRKFIITKEFVEELNNNNLMTYDYKKYKDLMIVYHGTKDELVPIEDVKEFCNKNCINIVEVEGADHRFMEQSKFSKFAKEGTVFLFK